MEDVIAPRELFGGAVELSFPSRFVDISDFRTVPDNQEVYTHQETLRPLYKTSVLQVSSMRDVQVFTDASADQSLIVEFVVGPARFYTCSIPSSIPFKVDSTTQDHHDVPDLEAGEFFYHDLATANDAAHAVITSLTQLRSDAVPNVPNGTHCCLVEGEQVVGKGRQGGEALNKIHVELLVIRLPAHGTDVLVTLNTPIYISEHSAAANHAGAGYKETHLSAPQLFRRIIATLSIRDWGLFGGGVMEA